MIKINKELNNFPKHIKRPNYDPGKLRAGIAHIGVGNFHRAHQAYYTHKLLNLAEGNEEWGIAGIGITSRADQKKT
jgi:mannitol 2-dehydrogenase